MNKKKLTEEELQQYLEKGDCSSLDSNNDVELYKTVFNAINEPESKGLPTNFADNVISRVEAKAEPLISLRDLQWAGAVLVAFLIVVLIAVPILKVSLDLTFLNFLWQNKWWILISVATVALIQLADSKLLRRIST